MRARMIHAGQALWLGLWLLPALHGPACAADDKRAAQALRAMQERVQRLQQSQQALEQEKTQWAGEKQTLDGKLRAQKGELDRARAALERAKAQSQRDALELQQAEGLRADRQALTDKLAAAERQLAEAREQARAAAESTSQSDARMRQVLAAAQQDLEQRGKQLASCETLNQGLYRLNTDLLAQYVKSLSASRGLMQGGPFTQLAQVRAENEASACQDKLDDLRVGQPGKPQN